MLSLLEVTMTSHREEMMTFHQEAMMGVQEQMKIINLQMDLHRVEGQMRTMNRLEGMKMGLREETTKSLLLEAVQRATMDRRGVTTMFHLTGECNEVFFKSEFKQRKCYDTAEFVAGADLNCLQEIARARRLKLRYRCCWVVSVRGIRHGNARIWSNV